MSQTAIGPGTGNGANNLQPNPSEHYNSFDLSNLHLYTQRFDEIKPNLVRHCKKNDVIQMRTSHDLRTFTLKSPVLNGIKMKQSFYEVPMSVIMPHSWEYLVRQPIVGDDVPANAYPSYKLSQLFKTVATAFRDFGTDIQYFLELSRLVLNLGPDSLLQNLGYNYDYLSSSWFEYSKDFINWVYSNRDSFIFYDAISGNPVPYSDDLSSVRNAVYKWQTGDYLLSTLLSANTPFIADAYSNYFSEINIDYIDEPVDLSSVVAYHMANAQFATNPYVDSIFNASQWWEYMQTFALSGIYHSSSHDEQWFTFNGKSVMYDFISNHSLTCLHETLSVTFTIGSDVIPLGGLVFFNNLFCYDTSLRNDDYFTTSRVRPLAVGNTMIDVNSNKVNVVDVNKQLWTQRYLQAVNRTNQDISEYLSNIEGGKKVSYDPQPICLCNTFFDLGKQEIEQTSSTSSDSPQGNIVTLLRNGGSQFLFETQVQEPCWIIGCSSFFVSTPVYTSTIHPQFFLKDRNDWYNPYLEHIGDQPVKSQELDSSLANWNQEVSETFGYQLRYSQYRYMFNTACGAFKYGKLPSWFIDAYSKSLQTEDIHLNSYFIRNHNDMIDPLYLSLTGFDKSEYFHFIISMFFDFKVNSTMQRFPTL